MFTPIEFPDALKRELGNERLRSEWIRTLGQDHPSQVDKSRALLVPKAAKQWHDPLTSNGQTMPPAADWDSCSPTEMDRAHHGFGVIMQLGNALRSLARPSGLVCVCVSSSRKSLVRSIK